MKVWLDRALIALFALGTIGHFYGSFALLEAGSVVQVWSFAGALCASLLVALNILRSMRPADQGVAWMAFLGCAGWVVIAVLFGKALGNLLDFRVVWHAVAAAGLALFSLATAIRKP